MNFTTKLHHLRLLLLLVVGMLPAPLFAQEPALDPMASGQRYIIAFPDTTSNRLDSRYPDNRFKDTWSLFLYSAVENNRVRIISGGGASTNLTLSAGTFTVQKITTNPVVTRINSIESNTVSVESDYPIVLYCFVAARQGMEAWTPIPVDMWGTRYNAAAVPGEVIGQIGLADETAIPFDRSAAPSEILVMAAYDNTKVTFTPGPTQKLVDARLPIEVTLNAGQCYQVQSWVDTNADFDGVQVDLGGVSVTATHPIGVISGNTRALVTQRQQGLVMNVYKSMMIEWLSPEEEQGTEFVFMPTYDGHRPGSGPGVPVRDAEYARIYGTHEGTTEAIFQLSDSLNIVRPIRRDSLAELAFSGSAARITTDRPAQGMMHSSSVLNLASKIPCFSGIPCMSFEAWAPYMVEMTPREQWTSFAPYYAPQGPASPIEHYINVVTDTVSARSIYTETGELFPFTRRIAGTDLIWGSDSVVPGVTHYVWGKNGARFGGSVYGLMRGGEIYRPGRARKGSGAGIAAGDEGTGVLHPCEYEEYTALSYGYPLAPRRAVLRTSDSLWAGSARECAKVVLDVHSDGPNAAGIMSATLMPGSENAKLSIMSPSAGEFMPGLTSATVVIVPIDPTRDASAVVRIEDRAGKVLLVPYTASAAALGLKGGGKSVEFGARFYTISTDTTLVYTNGTDHDIVLGQVKLADNSSAYDLVSTSPAGPAEKPARSVVIKPGESFMVTLRIHPDLVRHWLDNTLVFTTDCQGFTTPLHGTMAPSPALLTYDIDFGVVRRGDPMVFRDLRICNIGGGTVTFASSLADSVISWGDGRFVMSRAGLDSLKRAVLNAGECIVVSVGVNPVTEGVLTTTAHLSASVSSLRDSSVWRVIVSPGAGVDDRAYPGYGFTGVTPNPVAGSATISYTLGAPGHATIAIHDPSGALVATLVDGVLPSGGGSIAWDATGLPAGVYYCRISAGGWSSTRPIVLVR